MHESLPREPNLREELTRKLAVATANLGESQEARKFRLAEIKAHEEHLWNAVTAQSTWYREHFPGVRRLQAFMSYLLSRVNGLIWGYGEKVLVLARNVLLLSLVIYPTIYWAMGDLIVDNKGDEVHFIDAVLYSLDHIVPGGPDFNIRADSVALEIVATSEAILGVVMGGLFASYIFRWILHR